MQRRPKTPNIMSKPDHNYLFQDMHNGFGYPVTFQQILPEDHNIITQSGK